MADPTSEGGPSKHPKLDARRQSILRLRSRAEGVAERVGAKELWRRLDTADFMNRGTLLAALLLVEMIPFGLAMASTFGRDFATGLSHRMGLNAQASQILSDLFTRTTTGSAPATTTWNAWLIAGIVGLAATLMGLYEDIFGLKHLGLRGLPRQVVWVIVTIAWATLASLLNGGVHSLLLRSVLAFALLAGFFWWTLDWLLAGRVRWRALLPSGAATALLLIGLSLVSRLYLSNNIIIDNTRFGPLGVVLGLMGWLISIAVILIAGPILGIVWGLQQYSLRKAGHWLRVHVLPRSHQPE